MPLTYHIDTDSRVLLVCGEGVITQPERIQTMLAWIKDPAFKPGLDTFCDFSAAESTPKLSELREVVATIGAHTQAIGPTKVAILAPSQSRSAWRAYLKRSRRSKRLHSK